MIQPRLTLLPCLLAAASLLGGCGGEATPVSLQVLAAHQDDFDGREVRTCGTLRSHPSPRHYWIEDAALHRVELVPAELVEDYGEQEIEVSGRFSFAAGQGRRIQVTTLAATAC